IGISLPDQFARQRRMIDQTAQAVGDGHFKRVVVQDGRVDEGGELRLAARDVLGLPADAPPNRIELVDGRLNLLLRHGKGLRNGLDNESQGNGRLSSIWVMTRPKPRPEICTANGANGLAQ